jgi:hypothetical protein
MADCIHDIEEAWCGTCTPLVGPDSPLDDWINTITLLIPGDGEQPLPRDELIYLSGLAPGQVDRAVAAIRERYPDLPLVSDRNGIRFTMDEEAVRKFRVSRARIAQTSIRRSYRGAFLPYLQHAGIPDREISWMTRQINRLLEDMDDMIRA